MGSLNGVVEFQSSEYRPCSIGKAKTKAMFHRWATISEIVEPSIMKRGRSGGVVSGVYGIVELEDGAIQYVEPYRIRFLDSGNLFHENALFFKKKGENQMDNLQREVWEGWTPRSFIIALTPEIEKIMNGESWRKPFTTQEEMADYIVNHQPYYKKPIPEVNAFFAKRYGLK